MINDFFSDSSEGSNVSDLLKSEDFSTTVTAESITQLSNIPDNLCRKSAVEISCFPPKIEFSPIYPNSVSHQKMLVINTGIKSEFLSVKIEGSPSFTINTTGFTLEPNASQSIIISFQPIKPKEHSGKLTLSGRSILEVPFSGQCLESPLEIPSDNDQIWSNFSTKQPLSYIPIKNKDKTETFHVEFSTNCNSFKVNPESIDIEPESSEHLTVRYIPNLELTKIPRFHMRCETTGDLITRTFHIISLSFVDFGSIKVGKCFRKEVNFVAKNIDDDVIPSINPPFSIEKIASSSSFALFFLFKPKEGGNFHDIIKIGDNQIELMGEGVSMPFSFNPENLRIKNITNETISLSFSLQNSKSSVIIPQKADLHSNAWTFLNIDNSIDDILMITYNRNDDKNNFVWKFEIPKKEEAPVKKIQTEESFFDEPKKETIFADTDRVVTHPSFVNFFQSKTDSSFFVTGVDSFEVDGPSWIEFPSEIEVDSPIPIECKHFPSVSFTDKIIIQSDNSLPHELPIIGYVGKSDITCVSRSALTYALDDHYVTRIEVSNCGDLPGFVTFTASDETTHNIRVHPAAAIIEADSSQFFEFVVDSKPEYGLSIPIIMYSCDEIMRELRSFIFKDDFFNSNIPINTSEVIEMRSALLSIKQKEFNSVFKKTLCAKELELYTFERSTLKRLTIFPLQLECYLNEANMLTIINMSNSTLAVKLLSQHRGIIVSPTNFVLQGYSEVAVNVKLLCPDIESAIVIQYEDDTMTVPIFSVSKPSPAVKKKVKVIKIEPKILDFGICYVDSQSPRKSNVKITNLTHKKVSVALQSRSRNWKFPSKPFTFPVSASINPFSTTELIFEFSPGTEFKFEEMILIETNTKESHHMKLMGNGVSKKRDNFIGTEADNLIFPICDVGRIQRGRIRIMNQKDQKCNIIASAQFPFICPIPRFSIDPNCYVLCPIHFSPKSEGKFSGYALFESDISETFRVKVNGRAILPK